MPLPASGTFRAVVPSFGLQPGLQQPWNPQIAQSQAKAPKEGRKRSNPCCKDCGHLYTTGVYADSRYHIRTAGGRYQCLVKANFADTIGQPDFPERSK